MNKALQDKIAKVEKSLMRGLDYKLTFGKMKGYTVRQAIWHDARYVAWAVRTANIFKLNAEATAYLESKLSEGVEEFPGFNGDGMAEYLTFGGGRG